MLASLASGTSRISGFLDGGDCRATLGAMRSLGVEIEHAGTEVVVRSRGPSALCAPASDIDCAGSGTTMRLLAGIVAARGLACTLTGSAQLRARPMERVVAPLEAMGARVESASGRAPLRFAAREGPLRAIDHSLPVASAQVKSCVLLAGLNADGPTTVREPGPARDHTERMLGAMGASISVDGPAITVTPTGRALDPIDVAVPGDISSAAFLLVAASIVPGSRLTVAGCGTNPTRTGILGALDRMGASITLENASGAAGEPVADLAVRASDLQAATFGGDEIVTMIDEIPLLALAATQARGTTIIGGARELRTKETDRIATTTAELSRLGARIEPRDDGMVIEGPTPLAGARVESHGDHRLAMTLAVAGLVARGETTVDGARASADSFPGFDDCLAALGAGVEVGS